MPSVALYTLGCKVSQYETEAIAEAFEAHGFARASFDAAADVYVINTCTVTAESDRKSRQIIRRAIKQNPHAIVCVVGCYSQTTPDAVAHIEGVDIVLGTADKLSVVERAIARLAAGKGSPAVCVTPLEGEPFEPMCVRSAPRTRAYVKIEDGCECRCSYCEIPNARGAVRSKPPADVIAEVEVLAGSGTHEIVLTGIETASYGVDFDTPYRLIDLLEELSRRESCPRIRLGSLSPELMREDLVRRLADIPILVPHVHLSMQSGSDAVLRRMRRRYNGTMAREAVARLRHYIPRVQITTDLIVGFPGEREEDFLDTVRLVREARFLDAHVFAYSRRPGTPAADMDDQVPEHIKHARSAQLIRIKNEVRDSILDELVQAGEPLSVIPEVREGMTYTAHSDTFVSVCVTARQGMDDLRGRIVDVIPTGHKDGVLYATIA